MPSPETYRFSRQIELGKLLQTPHVQDEYHHIMAARTRAQQTKLNPDVEITVLQDPPRLNHFLKFVPVVFRVADNKLYEGAWDMTHQDIMNTIPNGSPKEKIQEGTFILGDMFVLKQAPFTPIFRPTILQNMTREALVSIYNQGYMPVLANGYFLILNENYNEFRHNTPLFAINPKIFE
jgi:hypothetical protein